VPAGGNRAVGLTWKEQATGDRVLGGKSLLERTIITLIKSTPDMKEGKKGKGLRRSVRGWTVPGSGSSRRRQVEA